MRFYTGSELAWIHWMGLLAPLLDTNAQADFYEQQKVRGWVDQGVEQLDARELVPDHQRVGKAKEFADFTYGRVQRSFEENDPAKMEKIRAAADALGLDIDDAIMRVRGESVGDGPGGIWSPKRDRSPHARSGAIDAGDLAQQLGVEMKDGDLRASMSARKRRYSVTDSGGGRIESDEVVVVDCGSSYLRIGFGGEDLPRRVVKMEGGRVVGGGLRGRKKGAAYRAGAASAKSRITIDWDGLARIFDRTFRELSIVPRKHKFVLTKLSDANPESVELLQEWMHDTFDVPCLRVVSSAECILTAAHRETGVVVDIGNRMEVTAICHGYENRAAHFFTFFGGFDLTEKMQKLLATAGINTGDNELVRKIKEEHCRVRESDEDEVSARNPCMAQSRSDDGCRAGAVDAAGRVGRRRAA